MGYVVDGDRCLMSAVQFLVNILLTLSSEPFNSLLYIQPFNKHFELNQIKQRNYSARGLSLEERIL